MANTYKTVALVSLGCDKNLTDSEVMLGLLADNGYTMTNDTKTAEIIILNTCGFIKTAVDESYENAYALAKMKKTGKNGGVCKLFIITGCMTQRYKDEIFQKIPEADAILGTGDYEAIIEVIQKHNESNEKQIVIKGINHEITENARGKRVISTPRHYAYLKIAEGCDNHCTYCTIPSIRGKFRSRSMENIVSEAESLVQNGVREIIIVAQDTTQYGIDLYNGQKLHELLKKLSDIDELDWIRLLYCYPEHIYDELIKEITDNNKIVKYIDMPVQHISDKILKLMGRKSTKAEVLSVIERLRESIPEIVLRTTLITGFPNESKEDFAEVMEFIKATKFDRLGVFAYSKEDGTPAAKMDGQIDEKEKERRRDKLMTVQMKISLAKNKKCIGKTYTVVTEGYLPEDNVYYGRTERDCPDVDGMTFFTSDEPLNIGDIVSIVISGADEYDLFGE